MKPTSAEIRRQFIDFFVQRHGHTFVPSSPVVPADDPTLMFTNAGMNQFKDVFLGTGTRPYKRAANTQKCIRAGGKHNDLDDVGKDTYHHTFFEMLGNWSFGEYFKREAIAWAWELLTSVWGIDKSRLHATVFEGSPEEDVPRDEEAFELWKSVTDIDHSHIHWGGKKDNFWEMGDTGPCGPCSEIHIDLTPDRTGRSLVNADDARVIEIWNLVFIQYNRGTDGTLTPLPARHVDTGMGFERITAVLQGKRSNYDTDIFQPLFGVIQRITGAPGYRGTLLKRDAEREDRQVLIDVAYRVIADHVRCLTFALADGAMPSNEGRGYVLRRILRRAFRYGWQYLGTHEPFLHKLVPAVVDLMDEAFPELRAQTRHVSEVIREEEESFGRTLERGIALFDNAAEYARTHHHGRIKGEDAFRLHDTYGFPIDLTQIMAEERGLTVDVAEYERRMEEARETARGTSPTVDAQDERMNKDLEEAVKKKGQDTDDSAKYADELRCKAHIIVGSAKAVGLFDTLDYRQGERVALTLDKTCMYAEQGGQVADTGIIRTDTGEIEVTSVEHKSIQVDNNVINIVKHIGRVLHGSISVPSPCEVIVSMERRRPIMQNHTSTHVLNWALREVLGEHVQQKGSLVDPERTRFDFSHPSAVTDEQLQRIERLVNEKIRKNMPVHAKEAAQREALKIHGLRAVFGEKYPDLVRVVSIGPTVDELLRDPPNRKWWAYSIEFCGGTHLKRTREVELFRLVEESAVARGIRRVVGVTGEAARQADRAAAEFSARLDEALRLEGAALAARVGELSAALATAVLPVLARAKLQDRLAELQEKARHFQKQQARQDTAGVIARADALLARAERVGGHAIIVGEMGSATAELLRPAMDSLRARAGSAAVCLAAECDGKVVLLAAMTPDLVGKGVRAGDLVREIAPIVGGRGGGKPDMAQGGGPDTGRIPAALEQAVTWLRSKLSV